MIWAKRKKEETMRIQRVRDVETNNRKLKDELFNFDVIRTFMISRAEKIFKGGFVLDEHNENIFNLLCYYHTNNPMFVNLAESMGAKNPSLEKGVFLAGNFGTGKTWLMKLFAKSARQTYYIRTSKEIAQGYIDSKDKKIPEVYLEPFKNPMNDMSVFGQPISGLCIDDIGAEGLKNNFGNISNVIGDLIEERYISKYTGVLLHGTTNLSAEELSTYYGGRVVSRMREIFNWVILKGGDRRK